MTSFLIVCFVFVQRLRRKLFQRLIGPQGNDGLWPSAQEPLAVIEELIAHGERKEATALRSIRDTADALMAQRFAEDNEDEARIMEGLLATSLSLAVLQLSFADAAVIWKAAASFSQNTMREITTAKALGNAAAVYASRCVKAFALAL